MTSVSTGPAETPEQTRARRIAYLLTLAADADEAVAAIDAQIEASRHTRDTRAREADDYRAQAREMGA